MKERRFFATWIGDGGCDWMEDGEVTGEVAKDIGGYEGEIGLSMGVGGCSCVVVGGSSTSMDVTTLDA